MLLTICFTAFSANGSDDFIYPDSDSSNIGSTEIDSALKASEVFNPGTFKGAQRQPLTDRGKFNNDFKGGHSFDRSGTYSGRVDSFGHAYDKSGNYSGRIDHFGNVYDRSGNYSGKVKPRP